MKFKKLIGLKKAYFVTVIMLLIRLTSLNASNSKESMLAFESGKAKFEVSDYKGAVKDLTKAIELDATDANMFFFRGKALFQLGKNEESISDFTIAIALNPKKAEFYYFKSIALADQEDYKLAYREMNKAIELKSDNAEYYFIRSQIEENLGYVTDAKEDYKKAITLGYKE